MTTQRIEEMVEEFVTKLAKKVHYYTGKGQYPENSDEQKAFLDGAQTAVAMMCIDLSGTPKTVGMLTQALTEAHQAGKKEGIDEAVESCLTILERVKIPRMSNGYYDPNAIEAIGEAIEAIKSLQDNK